MRSLPEFFCAARSERLYRFIKRRFFRGSLNARRLPAAVQTAVIGGATPPACAPAEFLATPAVSTI